MEYLDTKVVRTALPGRKTGSMSTIQSPRKLRFDSGSLCGSRMSVLADDPTDGARAQRSVFWSTEN
jgi:hypothetical protein